MSSNNHHFGLILLFLCSTTHLFASVYPVNFDTRIENSGQVVMAKVLSSKSYWDAKRENIYTSFTMEAMAYLKSSSSVYTFEFIIRGGEVDDELEILTPNIQMEIGKEYLLIVENASLEAINPNLTTIQSKIPHFQAYSHIQGVLPYVNGEYIDYISTDPMTEKKMMETVLETTHFVATTPAGEVWEPRVLREDKDQDGIFTPFDCDDNDPNFPLPVGAACNDGIPSTLNDVIQADGCTCAGNAGLPVDCSNIIFSSNGGIIKIENLTAKSEKIELIGIETNGQAQIICDGDCDETEYIDGLVLGNKRIKIWMYGDNETACQTEKIIEITEYICNDEDNDNLCDIKDCAPDDPNFPAISGTSCDDGDDNTLRDIILADGCTCAGVPIGEKPGDGRTSPIVLKNGKGEINPVFNTGTVEDDNHLIIEGNGFGTAIGSVEFPNSDSGGRSLVSIDYATDIISWTNTQIRVKIPSRVGNGTLIVKNSAGSVIGTENIKIGYAINTLYSSFKDFTDKTRQNVKFTNRNTTGGYTILLNTTSDFAYSTAVPAFERALDTWVCSSGINWQLDKSGTTTGFANDGNCVALYASLPIGVLGITTSRYKASGNSNCNLEKTVWYLKEFDIQFTPNEGLGGSLSWNYGPQVPGLLQYDLETVILHELGHAHGLGHIINAEEIMHYSISNGVAKRTITHEAHEGSAYKINLSTQANCMTAHTPMIPLTLACSDVATKVSTSARVKLMLEGYYDSTNDILKTELLDNGLLPNEQPFDEDPYFFSGGAVVSVFPTGAVDWLLVELRDETDMTTVVAQQSVLVKNDGTLIDASGSDLITFDDVEDGNYYIAIFHKSHLPIISHSAQSLNDDPVLFDFSNNESTTMGEGQQKEINGKYFMNSGDFDGNGFINNLDFNLWKQAGAAINTYSPADADGNGIINNLDFNLWKANSSKVSILNRGE